MRIIGGASRGRTLKAPTWGGMRPTSDRVRETLFNILAPRVAEARVLDVFAGTGAVGLEALSRGAASAVFIECDRRAAALIRENVTRCSALERCAIIREAAETALARPVPGGPFDVVVLDPPYDCPRLEAIVARGVTALAPAGVLVLEHAWRRSPPEPVEARRTRTVRSGDSALSFYEVAVPAPERPDDP
ncbi:MAG: 16S rRNA (guanine(966)-N(2))-methyltransferase RsmD [Chloroflexi bacterium]|nr:16S rRNA (guanine(966)-N(2))-methyltransferase RsmD [Chloroflexota bacterium]